MKQTCYLLIATILLFASCKKEDNNLPAPTHSGANTFACKINGKKFLVKGKSSRSNPLGVFLGGGYNTGTYWSAFANTKDIFMSLDFADPGTQFPSSKPLKSLSKASAAISFNSGITIPNGSNYYATNEIDTGLVTITNNTTIYASGTFWFNARNGNGDLIQVTEGQFDIEF